MGLAGAVGVIRGVVRAVAGGAGADETGALAATGALAGGAAIVTLDAAGVETAGARVAVVGGDEAGVVHAITAPTTTTTTTATAAIASVGAVFFLAGAGSGSRDASSLEAADAITGADAGVAASTGTLSSPAKGWMAAANALTDSNRWLGSRAIAFMTAAASSRGRSGSSASIGVGVPFNVAAITVNGVALSASWSGNGSLRVSKK